MHLENRAGGVSVTLESEVRICWCWSELPGELPSPQRSKPCRNVINVFADLDHKHGLLSVPKYKADMSCCLGLIGHTGGKPAENPRNKQIWEERSY